MKHTILFSVIVFSSTFMSCDKFINRTSPTLLSPEKFYKTEADIKLAVAGTYSLLRKNYANYFQVNEMPSDNANSYGESEADLGIWDKLTWTAYSTNFESIWINYYNTIAQCNLILSKINEVTFAQAGTKAQYIAEMKFIRALMYFELTRDFGELPLVLDVVSNDKQAFAYLRKPVSEIYAQIEKDLLEAEAGVPVVYTLSADKGRVTQIAVRSLLGKVYLYEKKYSLAEAKLLQVVSDSNYGLLDNLEDVFSTTNELNKEIIFTVQYSRLLIGSGEGSYFAAYFLPSGGGLITATSASYNIGSYDLYTAFEKGDKRRDLLIGFLFKPLGTSPKNFADSISGGAYYYTKKFPDNPPTFFEGENNWIVIRYSDVKLLYAEALNEQGKSDQALAQVNDVRRRAGVAALDTNLPKDEARMAIKKERRLELCFEGHRWPDLVRWGDYFQVMTAYKDKYKVAQMTPSKYQNLFPIPNRERIINPALTQNTGY